MSFSNEIDKEVAAAVADLRRDWNRQVGPFVARVARFSRRRRAWLRVKWAIRDRVNGGREMVALKIAPWLYREPW